MKKKKKVKSKKGFTLIELLGTIVIIGILGTIAITSVVNIKKSTNSRFDNSQIELMKQAGQTYFTDNKRLLPIVEGQTNFVTLDELIEKGYINKLYNSKKEEFDAKDSYVWVQKQDNGSYKYDCYCTINGTTLAGTTIIPKSEVNNTKITFEYIGNFYNANNRHYTNGKSDATIRVSLIREEVSKYKYEIYKKLSTGEDGYVQYKISQRDQLINSTVDIQLKSKDYSEGEYFILVTAYNKSGRASQSIYSDGIYVDKTPPSCNITTTYQKDPNSIQNLWYSSKSKNGNNQELGLNKKLPISIDGDDDGSGVNKNSRHIFLDSGYYTQLDNGDGTYNVGNTNKNGQEYYASIEDNVGNKATCSQIYYVDTELPTCKVNPVSAKDPVNGWYNISSTSSAELVIQLSQLDNVDISDYGLTTSSTVTYNKKGEGTQNDTTNKGVNWYGYVKDYAGNTNSCSANFKVDIHAPTINSFTLTNSQDNYNDIQPNININVDDKNNITYGFYSNHTTLARNYTEKGEQTYKFSALNPNRIDDFNGSTSAGYNGATYNINASALDEAGNETISSANYTVYKKCSVTTSSVGTYGACSASCDGGIQYAPEIYTDSNINERCGSEKDVYSQECNTDECPDPDENDTSDNSSITCPTITSETTEKKWVNHAVTIKIDYSTSNGSSYTYYTRNNGQYSKRGGEAKENLAKGKFTFEGGGKRRLKIVVTDSSGNTRNCFSKVYYIDKKSPGLSAVALSENSSFQKNGCNSGLTCKLSYGQVSNKYVGVKLTANHKEDASEHSPIADWGAQAKYQHGGKNCAWGDGIDYKWSGAAVCDSTGSGKVKRCYKVKDAAGNKSDRVCTCQDGSTVTIVDDPNTCFK